jgi:hypothetical protein
MLLGNPAVRERIANECRGFDFQVEFEGLIGIPLERWLYVMFAVYGYYLQGGNALESMGVSASRSHRSGHWSEVLEGNAG